MPTVAHIQAVGRAEQWRTPSPICGSSSDFRDRVFDFSECDTMTRPPHFLPPSRSIADEHGAARARAQMQNSSYPDIRKLDCSFAEGVLTVRGRLPSFYLKQVLWSLVGRLPEIDELADQIEVIECRSGQRSGGYVD